MERDNRRYEEQGFDRGGDGDYDGRKKSFGRRKACRFCNDEALKIDFKDLLMLSNFINDQGRIVPRRVSGNCAWHQRVAANAVKIARQLALLPYVEGVPMMKPATTTPTEGERHESHPARVSE